MTSASWLKRALGTLAAISAFALLATPGQAASPHGKTTGVSSMNFQLTSTAFEQQQTIPKQYTADGKDMSPPLKWGTVPETAKSLALICDDPDAPMGIWVHWVLYDIPINGNELKESIPPQPSLPDGAKQGKNSFGKIGYGGPSPPPGKPHRYYFKLYALDKAVNLQTGGTKDQLLAVMQGHIVGEAQLMGVYKR